MIPVKHKLIMKNTVELQRFTTDDVFHLKQLMMITMIKRNKQACVFVKEKKKHKFLYVFRLHNLTQDVLDPL